ncbi:MAG: hypothetical protein HQL22_10420, partial [Candidatus Omnitrophica bacterium]|nr:hypothetical protein [Candidatus Omnitrophota bacterium]
MFDSVKRKIISWIMLVVFSMSQGSSSWAQSAAPMTAPGSMVALSAAFIPPTLKGLKVYPNNPFQLDFILEKGKKTPLNVRGPVAQRLVKYFLAALTVPEKELWVNLSPYEKERIIPDSFGETTLGRDLLAQDYLLKQITSSLLSPDSATGKLFWQKVYAQAYRQFGTTDIPMEAFHKVWIVPEHAVVYEKYGTVAYVAEAKLKVLLDTDYLATVNNSSPTGEHVTPEGGSVSPSTLPTYQPMNTKAFQGSTIADPTQDISKNIMREVVIPVLEKEVNEGANFAIIRQVYSSLILAAWFKRKIKSSLLYQAYVDRHKISGLEPQGVMKGSDDDLTPEKIWDRYVVAFKKGVVNIVRDEKDDLSGEVLPRKYFTGGAAFDFSQAGVLDVLSDSKIEMKMPLEVVAEGVSVQLKGIRPDGSRTAMANAGQKTAKTSVGLSTKRSRQSVVEELGLKDEQAVENFIEALLAFEQEVVLADPFFAVNWNLESTRQQERFVDALRRVVSDFNVAGLEKYALPAGIWYAVMHVYGDLTPKRKMKSWEQMIEKCFSRFINDRTFLNPETLMGLKGVPAYFNLNDDAKGRLLRSFFASTPVIISRKPQEAASVREAFKSVAHEAGIEVAEPFFLDPFKDETQLIGAKVPDKDGQNVIFGRGKLLQEIEKAAALAENKPGVRRVLLMENLESLESGVRLQLQEMVRKRVLSHPDLGDIRLPDNFQIIFTVSDPSLLKDVSFLDRVVLKSWINDESLPQTLPGMPEDVSVDNLKKAMSIKTNAKGENFLVLPGARILLAERFKGITTETMEDRIYKEIGLVLDIDTVRMLVGCQQSVDANAVVLRVTGVTGLGKTYTARAYALLRGSSFFGNPVSPGLDFGDLHGALERSDKGKWFFNLMTSFNERLTKGGVIALSELNTLVDQNERAALAWWLLSIVHAPRNAAGERIVELYQSPVSKEKKPLTLTVHRQALIVVDVNPVSYQLRGMFPGVFVHDTPAVNMPPLIDPENKNPRNKIQELQRLKKYARMFLSQPFFKDGVKRGEAIFGENLEKSAETLSKAFWEVARAFLTSNIGRGEAGGFSLRELKRLCEDVQIRTKLGEPIGVSLEKAIRHHLVYRWLNGDNEADVLSILKLDHQAEEKSEDILAYELITAGRHVHLRVGSRVATRPILARLKEKEPKAKVVLINVTHEIDRARLEGVVVPDERGDGYLLGQGLLARLDEEARLAGSDVPVIYVLENIHRLKVEDAVALNEVLQEGALYVKGQEKRQLAANGRILAISRSDSPIEWADAEQARFVSLAVSDEGDSLRAETANIEPQVDALLKSLAVREDIAVNIKPALEKMFADFVSILKRNMTSLDSLSSVNLARFSDDVCRLIHQEGTAPLTMGRFIRAVTQVIEKRYIEAISSESVRTEMKEAKDVYLGIFSRIYAENKVVVEAKEIKGVPQSTVAQQQVSVLAEATSTMLADNVVRAVVAPSDEARRTALAELRRILQKPVVQEMTDTTPTPRGNVQHGDVVNVDWKLLAPEIDGDVERTLRFGELVAVQTKAGKIFILNKDGKVVDAKGLDVSGGIEHLTSLGDHLAVMSKTGKVYFFNKDGQVVDANGFDVPDGIRDLTSFGDHLAVWSKTGKVFIFDKEGKVVDAKGFKVSGGVYLWQSFGDNLAVWSETGKVFIFNKEGKVVDAKGFKVPYGILDWKSFGDNLVVESKRGKVYVFNKEGQVVDANGFDVPGGVKRWESFGDNLFVVSKTGTVYFFNKEGKVVDANGFYVSGGVEDVFLMAGKFVVRTKYGKLIVQSPGATGLMINGQVHELSTGLVIDAQNLPENVNVLKLSEPVTAENAKTKVADKIAGAVFAPSDEARQQALAELSRIVQKPMVQEMIESTPTPRGDVQHGDVVNINWKLLAPEIDGDIEQTKRFGELVAVQTKADKIFILNKDGKVVDAKGFKVPYGIQSWVSFGDNLAVWSKTGKVYVFNKEGKVVDAKGLDVSGGIWDWMLFGDNLAVKST